MENRIRELNRARSDLLLKSEVRHGGGAAYEGDEDKGIDRELELHKKLTEEISLMTGELRQKSTDMYRSLQQDNRVLDSAASVAENNLAKIEHQNSRLVEHMRKSFSQIVSVWTLLGLVFVIFFVMFFFIRFGPPKKQ